MKKYILLSALSILTFYGCSNVLDKPLNTEFFEKVKEVVSTNEDYNEMKKKYIIDNLSVQLGLLELSPEVNIPTFGNQINSLVSEYDSLNSMVKQIRIDNAILSDFIELKDASCISIDKYKGYLNLKVKFNNPYDKKVLYIGVNYYYVDKYDQEFFDESAKLTDQLGGDFRGEIEISTTEEYNDAAEFFYTTVPVRASKAMREELGAEVADKKVMTDFLMKGLHIETIGIVFED